MKKRKPTPKKRLKSPPAPGAPGAPELSMVRLVPRWDARMRELRLGDVLVKRFGRLAPAQERILAAFEEEGWPPVIDDPLTPTRDRSEKQRLRETIANLNQHMENPLIHFESDGTGEAIRWRLV